MTKLTALEHLHAVLSQVDYLDVTSSLWSLRELSISISVGLGGGVDSPVLSGPTTPTPRQATCRGIFGLEGRPFFFPAPLALPLL